MGPRWKNPGAYHKFQQKNIEQHEEGSCRFGDSIGFLMICLRFLDLTNVLEIEFKIRMIRRCQPFPCGQRPVWDFCPGSKRSTSESSMWNLLSQDYAMQTSTQNCTKLHKSLRNPGSTLGCFLGHSDTSKLVSYFTPHLTRASVGFGSVFRFRGLLGGFWRYPKPLELLGSSCKC